MHSSSAEIAAAPLSLTGRRTVAVSWPLLLGLAGFLVPVLAGWGLADGDTYLHIAIGRWMFAHGHVLTRDPFSFTMLGVRSSAQEWGSDVLIASVFQIAGWSGLVLLGAASLGATLAYLARWLLTRLEPLHAVLLTLLAALMMVPSLFARPHVLVWPLTALWVGTLVRSSEEGRAPPWWLLIVMLIWANLHGSFIIGPALAVMLAVDSMMSARAERGAIGRRWLLFVLGALGCALVNPQGYRLLLFPFLILSMKGTLALIPEWQPPNFQQPQILGVWMVAIVALAFAGRVRLSLARSILLVGLMYMALEHVRNVALLGLVSPFLLARPVAERWQQSAARSGRDADAMDRWFRTLAAPAAQGTLWVAVALAGLTAVASLNFTKPQPPDYARPRAALDALLSQAPGGRIFNDLAFGDYLIYRGVPDFVDDRIDVYGDAFLTSTAAALSLTPSSDLEGLLARYHIDAILVGSQWPALQILDRLPEWQRVYSDKVVVAYVRRGSRRS